MTPNAALIRKVMAHIRAHPEGWNQNDWGGCGMSHCFGGWALVLGGRGDLLDDDHLLTLEWNASDLLGLSHAQGMSVDTGLFYSGYEDTVDEYEKRITRVTGVRFPTGLCSAHPEGDEDCSTCYP